MPEKTIKFQPMEQKKVVFEKCGLSWVEPAKFDKHKPGFYTFVPKVMAYADMDLAAGLARFQPREAEKLDRAYITKLALDVDNAPFPAPVYFYEGNTPLQVDGNHTLEAGIQVGATHIQGFYLFCSHQPLLVASILNTHTAGKAVPEETVLQQCVRQYLEKTKLDGREPPVKEFAALFMVLDTALARALRHHNMAEDLATKHNVKVEKLQPTHLDTLGQVWKINRKAAAEISKLIVQHSLTTVDAEEIIREYMDGNRDDREKAQYLKEKKEALNRATNSGTLPLKKKRKSTDKDRKWATVQDGVSKFYRLSVEADDNILNRLGRKVANEAGFLDKVKDAIKFLQAISKSK